MQSLMKQPKIIKTEHVKCISCNLPIHLNELGAITSFGMCHDNIVCLIGLVNKEYS